MTGRRSRLLPFALAAAAALVLGRAPAGLAAPSDPELVVVLQDREQSPVAGGSISVVGPSVELGPPFAFKESQVSDAKGRATFRVPRAGVYAVHALAAEHRSHSATVKIAEPARSMTLQLVMREMKVAAFTVTAKTSDDSVVEDAAVHLQFAPEEAQAVRPPEYDAFTDRLGVVRFHVADPGTWTIRVRHPLFEEYEFGLVVPSPLEDVNLAAILAPRTKAGRVVVRVSEERTGARIVGADVTARSGDRTETGVTLENGEYGTALDAHDAIEVRVRAEGFLPAFLRLGADPRRAIFAPLEIRMRSKDAPTPLAGGLSVEPPRKDDGDSIRFAVTLSCPDDVAQTLDADFTIELLDAAGSAVQTELRALKLVRGATFTRRESIRAEKPGAARVRVRVEATDGLVWQSERDLPAAAAGSTADSGSKPRPPTDKGPTESDPAEPPADFSGTWRHTSGTTLTLTQTGALVEGTWSHLDSKVTGRVKGRSLEFETTSPRGVSCHGKVTLDPSGRSFFGAAQVVGSDGGQGFHFDAERAR